MINWVFVLGMIAGFIIGWLVGWLVDFTKGVPKELPKVDPLLITWQVKLTEQGARPVILIGAFKDNNNALILLSEDLDRVNLRILMRQVNWEVSRMV